MDRAYMSRVQKVIAVTDHYQICACNGIHRPGTFSVAPTICCHIYSIHPFVNNAAGTTIYSDIGISVATCFIDFSDKQVLQSISSCGTEWLSWEE